MKVNGGTQITTIPSPKLYGHAKRLTVTNIIHKLSINPAVATVKYFGSSVNRRGPNYYIRVCLTHASKPAFQNQL